MEVFSSFVLVISSSNWNLGILKLSRISARFSKRSISSQTGKFPQIYVYLTLCAALTKSAVGANLHILFQYWGNLTFLACIGIIIWLSFTPSHVERVSLDLMSFALFEGATIGTLIHLAIEVDLSVVAAAFVRTTLSFACSSGAALVARHKEYLYFGGMLSSGVSIPFVVVFCFCYLWWFLSPLHI
ncbi:Bax inhibitor 1-related protein [Corchorus olitorius]|uniref:Bax inhibitor 1-related protein n=1 Tax=Corchorus olitorius TaxID=93759 RepID=A0A1R3G2Z5_9ROSI|nr:Bax inhibitor 1-related protein [Corchorus olitorius]